MRGAGLPGLAAALGLAGCGPVEPELNNAQLADQIENVAEYREPPDKGPRAPVLAELRRDEVPAGAGCDFTVGGRLGFVSVAPQALAKVNGALLNFGASGPVGPTGGFFVTERFSISIGRVADPGDSAGETVAKTRSWPARLVLTDRRQEENAVTRLEGVWRCGA
jgi:hypothetical protein